MSGAGLAALALATGGCANALKISGGGTMSGYVAPKLKRIRVGVVGVGSRGTYALKRLAFMPGVEIAAFCDIKEEAMKRSRDYLAEKKFRPAREFLGPEAYKDLCQWDGVDVVYACVPWKLHAPVALAAMRADKHAFVEVPATMDVDSCWELVETSEATRRHCMMLENCCYGETEMLALNMCRLGVLGETVYGEAGYLHSGATRGFKLSEFRAEWYQEHRGNYYPTHGLGPVAQYMNINRGDRFDYLNSMETKSIGDFIRDGAARLEAPLQFVYNDKAHGQALPFRDQRIEKRKKVRSAPQGEHSNLQNEIKQKKAWIPWHSLFSEIFEIENPSLSGCS